MEELADFLDERLSGGEEDGNVLLRRSISFSLASELLQAMSEEQKIDFAHLEAFLKEDGGVNNIEKLISGVWERIDRNAGSDKTAECIDRIIVSCAIQTGGLTIELAEYLASWGECGGLSEMVILDIFKNAL